MSRSQLFLMLGGLSIFLFAVQVLENTINQSAAHKLKKMIRDGTSNNVKSFFSGLTVTAILQSSSVVSLMILAFVGSGAIALNHGVAAIIGANIGTTITDVIIAYVGFNFNISSFAMPMVGIGGVLWFFLGRYKWCAIAGQVLLSIGLIFVGIGYMKESVDFLSKTVDLKQYLSRGPRGFYLLGIVLTAILHSSGAMTIVAISAFATGIIDFDTTIIILLGANVGTTVTATLGAIGQSSVKKQIAASHVIFNLATSTVAMFFVSQISAGMSILFRLPEQNILALSRFQLIYNIICACVFLPINDLYTRFLTRLIPASHSDYYLASDDVDSNKPALFLQAVHADVLMFLKKIYKFNVHQFQIDQKVLLNDQIALEEKYKAEYVVSPEGLQEDYDLLKEIESKLTQILIETHQQALSPSSLHHIKSLHNSIVDMMYAAKTLKDIKTNINTCLASDNKLVQNALALVKNGMIDMYTLLADIIDRENVNSNITKLEQLAQTFAQTNDNMLSNFNTLDKQSLDPEELSSLIHINQGFETSMQMILRSVRDMSHTMHTSA